MKKKIIFLLTIIVLTIFGIFIKTCFNKEESSFQDNSSKQIKEENLLSMMLETSAGSGEYEMVTQSSWPTDGYIFNAELSKCENGGILGWDNTNKVVTMTGNMSDKCYVYFDVYKPTLAEYVISQYNGVQGNNNIYYHDGSLANGVSDGSYRYAGYAGYPNYYSCTYDGNDVENFISGNTYDIIDGNCSEIYKVVTSDGTVTYFDKSFEQYYYNTTSVEWDSNNNQCITVSGSADVYDFYGNEISQDMCNGIAYLDAEEDFFMVGITKVGEGIETLVSEAKEEVINNYVCFGTDVETCPTDNLYRIIGVIDGKVKLIKVTSLGDMAWDSNNSNTWSTSSLNTYLNGTYLNTFSEDWQAKIATTTWKVGGISSNRVTASTMYTNEMNSTSSGTDGLTEYSSKVALMYAHDYGFAASPTAWTITLVNYSGFYDWLYLGSHLGSYEWLLSRDSSYTTGSYLVGGDGSVGVGEGSGVGSVTLSIPVRPVFFLESSVTYASGTGTSSDPIRIN